MSCKRITKNSWIPFIQICYLPHLPYHSESLGRQADQTSQSYRKSVLNIHWKDWCWSWNSNTLATWCEELTHWKKPWYWEILKAGGEGDNRGWGGWMASPTWWTWVWASSRSWWWIGKPSMLQFMGSQRAVHDWETFIMYIEWAEVAQPCPALCNPMDYSLPGSSVHGIFQARILEWGAISFSRRSSQPRDWIRVSCVVGRCFTVLATREVLHNIYYC